MGKMGKRRNKKIPESQVNQYQLFLTLLEYR